MIEIFRAGGIVIIPLVFFSIVSISLIIERAIFWIRLCRHQREFGHEMLSIFRNKPESIIAFLQGNLLSPLARILLEALEIRKLSPQQFHLSIASAIQGEIPRLRRFDTAFSTIISVSPLLGLLGTILGLITSFDAIELGSMGQNAKAVTGGISEALVSTAAGLVVAIGTLFFANIFRGLYRREMAFIQEYAGQMEVIYETHFAA
ncbi:MAG: MotA/TolQ/ExbB proton channel family protein [Prochlorococcus sp.]